MQLVEAAMIRQRMGEGEDDTRLEQTERRPMPFWGRL